MQIGFYQRNEETKDAEICCCVVFHLAAVGGKIKHFHQHFFCVFFPQQSETQMSMFEDSVLKVVFNFSYTWN
jgi:hypothetical protein